MAKTDEDVLKFTLSVDIRDPVKDMAKFQKQMAKLMKEIAQDSERSSKEQTKRNKQTKKETAGLTDAVKELGDAYEEEGKKVTNLARVIAALEKQVESLQGAERAAAQESLVALQKEHEERKKIADAQEKTGKKQKKRKPPDYSFGRKNIKKFKTQFKELGEQLKAPLEAFLQRDLKGILEGSMKGAGATLNRSLKLSKFLAGASGEALSKRGERESFRGKAMGGSRGRHIEENGERMKRMGAMMSQVGGVMGKLAKLGPIFSVATGAIMALVKLFLDADAAVKEFNKSILSSAGNLSIFERSGRNAGEAAIHLEGTLNDLRAAAYDLPTNLAYGITKDDHEAMVNTLTQEGVSLGRIEDEAELAGKSVKELATQFTVTGVAYSRAFGVGLAEVAQFQAEMMSEMGKSVDDTQKAFSLMARGAAESGIASNKFFAAMRAMSPDLGLFNLRLEDSVAVLTKISKVMSPRNAQKFMQESVAGLKSMGRQEKLRMSMLAGSGKTKGIVERDIERKTKNLIGRLTKDPAQEKALRAAFEDQGYAGIKSSIDQLGPEVSAALTESALDLQLQKSQASKGQYGSAMATADLGIGGALEMQQSALTFLSKGKFKSIADALGSMDLEQVAESLGKSDEQVKQMAKLEVAIDAQRKALIGKEGRSASDVAKMGNDEVINSMSDDMQKSLAIDKDGISMDQKMMVLAQRQSTLTSSLLDKFETMFQWFQNEFYNVIMGIWETILDFPFVSNKAAREKVHALRGARAGGSAELKGIARGDNVGKGLADSNVMQSFLKNLSGRGGMDADKAKGVSDLVAEATRDISPETLASALEMDTGFRFGETIGGRKNRTEFRENVGKFGYEEAAKRAGASSEQAVAGVGKLAYTPGNVQQKFENFSRVEKGLKDLGLLGAGPGGAAPAAAPTSAESQPEKAAEHLATVAEGSKKQEAVLTQQGIKIAPATIKEEAKGMESAMLSALRTALFEYYMYSGTDRSALASAMKTGGVTDPRAMAQYFTGKSVETGGTGAALAGLSSGEARPNARGGLVTGIANGMAMVAAHGEGLASVGRGERIVPSGGGGNSSVQVNVNGIGGQDLQRLIHGKVVEGIREFKRRERLY